MDATTTPKFAPKTVIATFPSASRPGHSHEVRVGADGVIYCTCPSWKFQRNHPSARCCKHTKAAMARMFHGGIPADEQGKYDMPKPVRATRKATKPAPSAWERISR